MLTPDELDALTKRYLELDAKRSELAGECERIKLQLRASLDLGTHTAPTGVKVIVSPNRRFDPKLAEQVIPLELLSLVQSTGVDSKKAKAELPPKLYEACMKEAGEPKVSIS